MVWAKPTRPKYLTQNTSIWQKKLSSSIEYVSLILYLVFRLVSGPRFGVRFPPFFTSAIFIFVFCCLKCFLCLYFVFVPGKLSFHRRFCLQLWTQWVGLPSCICLYSLRLRWNVIWTPREVHPPSYLHEKLASLVAFLTLAAAPLGRGGMFQAFSVVRVGTHTNKIYQTYTTKLQNWGDNTSIKNKPARLFDNCPPSARHSEIYIMFFNSVCSQDWVRWCSMLLGGDKCHD